jgi:DNA ligase D-like protein (predicted 3'-phosphoesterase)
VIDLVSLLQASLGKKPGKGAAKRQSGMSMEDPLKKYKSKRNFTVTPEPSEGGAAGGDQRQFVIQKHWASRLHYDFRLELDGTMKSWAVPKGPSYDPHDKRMAVHVEDHPISYNSFEGTIPEKQYGAGKVIIWDKGTWHPLDDPMRGYRAGNLKFELHGHKMQGKWALIKIKNPNSKQDAWLLIKEKDEFTRNGNDWTDKLRPLQEEIKRMKLPDGWYDGEIVVHDENGKPNFNLLQLAFDGSNRAQIVYFIFDAPYLKGYDIREVRSTAPSVAEEALEAKPSDTVRFSANSAPTPQELVVAACQMGLEGVIGKRRDSRYVNAPLAGLDQAEMRSCARNS